MVKLVDGFREKQIDKLEERIRLDVVREIFSSPELYIHVEDRVVGDPISVRSRDDNIRNNVSIFPFKVEVHDPKFYDDAMRYAQSIEARTSREVTLVTTYDKFN